MYTANEIVHRRAIQRNSGDVLSPLQPCNSGSTRKSKKPRWLRIVSKCSVFLVLLIICLDTIRRIVPSSSYGTENFGVSIPEMEIFVNSAVKTMQVELQNSMERKVKESIDLMRIELNENLEDSIVEFRKKTLLTVEEFDDFFETFITERWSRKKNIAGVNGYEEVTSLNEIINYTKEIVANEIEKHAADGLGMVDYLSGGIVVEHSESYDADGKNRISSESKKMLSPSLGEPGHCFPLKGSSGFVVISLRKAIVPKSVTLEHVAKSVDYDRSSAPKQCRVTGWLNGADRTDVKIGRRKFLLTEFTYDLEKSNVQTYEVMDLPDSTSSLVNTIRLDFTSNYGSLFTCIYRLRVHGNDPVFVPM